MNLISKSMLASNAFHPVGGGETPATVIMPPSSKRFAGAISLWIATVILINGTSLFPYTVKK
jgi:hypothetical protein